MKKKNCRMTDLERAQHARAVQFRKMTDAQICEYLDSLLEREREARSAAPAPSKEEIVNGVPGHPEHPHHERPARQRRHHPQDSQHRGRSWVHQERGGVGWLMQIGKS